MSLSPSPNFLGFSSPSSPAGSPQSVFSIDLRDAKESELARLNLEVIVTGSLTRKPLLERPAMRLALLALASLTVAACTALPSTPSSVVGPQVGTQTEPPAPAERPTRLERNPSDDSPSVPSSGEAEEFRISASSYRVEGFGRESISPTGSRQPRLAQPPREFSFARDPLGGGLLFAFLKPRAQYSPRPSYSGDWEGGYEDSVYGEDDLLDRFVYTFNYQLSIDGEFDLEDLDEEWDRSDRYEAGLAYHWPPDGQVEQVVGAFFAFERKEWDDGAAEVEDNSFLVGFEGGALLYPTVNPQARRINVALHPYIRGAIGYADGDFENVPIDTGFASGDIEEFRFDFGLGADGVLMINRQALISVGAGVNWWWTIEKPDGFVSDENGLVLFINDDFDYRGREFFIRFLVSFLF